ncbi:MAG: porin [Proteobacteria bacterium]|nr:porin [Pseudomonadota bacterium]
MNRAVLVYYDGEESEVQHVDNDQSSTRVMTSVDYALEPELTIGLQMQLEFESNPSNRVTQNASTPAPTFLERRLQVYIKSKAGTLWLGQGNTASNAASEVDLSGTSIAVYSAIGDHSGALQFRADNEAASLTGLTNDAAMSNMDGLHRQDRLRYDSPSLSGFTLSGTLLNDSAWDLAVRHALDSESLKLRGALAVADGSRIGRPYLQVNGSISGLMSNGFNLTVAGGARDLDDADYTPWFFYGKIGYKLPVTAVAADFGYFSENAQEDVSGTAVGLAVMQTLGSLKDGVESIGLRQTSMPNWAVELFFGYRYLFLNDDISFEGATVGTKAIHTGMAGARVKF